MAKINIEYDTVAKTCLVTQDGVAVANVADICLYRMHKGDYSLGMVQREEDEANDTVTYRQTMAADIAATPEAARMALVNEMRDLLQAQTGQGE